MLVSKYLKRKKNEIQQGEEKIIKFSLMKSFVLLFDEIKFQDIISPRVSVYNVVQLIIIIICMHMLHHTV